MFYMSIFTANMTWIHMCLPRVLLAWATSKSPKLHRGNSRLSLPIRPCGYTDCFGSLWELKQNDMVDDKCETRDDRVTSPFTWRIDMYLYAYVTTPSITIIIKSLGCFHCWSLHTSKLISVTKDKTLMHNQMWILVWLATQTASRNTSKLKWPSGSYDMNKNTEL